MSITELANQIKTGKTTALAEVKKALEKADSCQKYNIFVNLETNRALARAEEIDAKIQSGEDLGPLAGVPYALKDNFLDFGAPSTASSHMLESFYAPLQATAVEKLEQAGAICIGKTNLDAFAHGGSTENSYFGPTLNSKDTGRVAGGSSGGSAVAVALGIVPFSLGSDTGGSIRQPAAFNGVVGVRPTYGTVSRFGVVAMVSSTDTIGCFAKTASDAELVMSIISGQDPNDSTTLPDFFTPETDTNKNLRIGLVKELLDGADPEVQSAVKDYAKKLESLGHEVTEVSLPLMKYALPIYYIIVFAEVASNLARYDSVRYGHRSKKSNTLQELYFNSRSEGFMPENKRRILLGNFVLSSGYYDAYYLKAAQARTLLIQDYENAFKNLDFLISPTTPSPAFKIGENTKDPLKMYLEDAMTVPPSLAGLPAVSAPAGHTKDGLDLAVQIIGPQQSDAKILNLIKEVENA